MYISDRPENKSQSCNMWNGSINLLFLSVVDVFKFLSWCDQRFPSWEFVRTVVSVTSQWDNWLILFSASPVWSDSFFFPLHLFRHLIWIIVIIFRLVSYSLTKMLIGLVISVFMQYIYISFENVFVTKMMKIFCQQN